jgi:hypothetical protein
MGSSQEISFDMGHALRIEKRSNHHEILPSSSYGSPCNPYCLEKIDKGYEVNDNDISLLQGSTEHRRLTYGSGKTP